MLQRRCTQQLIAPFIAITVVIVFLAMATRPASGTVESRALVGPLQSSRVNAVTKTTNVKSDTIVRTKRAVTPSPTRKPGRVPLTTTVVKRSTTSRVPLRRSSTTRSSTSTTPAVVTVSFVEGGDAGNPGANTGITTLPPVVSPIPAQSTVPTIDPNASNSPAPSAVPVTTTTLAPYPAVAALPSRATAASIIPYQGLGTWIDAFDWTVQKGGRTPKVSAQTVDSMAAAGVQTLFVQASRYDSADVAEPERLLPIINRAHELGMYVVAWYLPTFTDVNADLRRTVAIANLDIDGISIDIEARNVANVADRNRRLISYSQSLRMLLPGRFISNNIVQPNIMEAVPNLWPTEYGKAPATPTSYWTPFPYTDIAPFYDLWMIQSYWTQRSAGGGWRDAYKISVDNANRLRAILGRPDLPLYLIGGVGDRPLTPNDLAGWLLAHFEVKSVGASFYDWVVTPPTWWSALWATRSVVPGQAADSRFTPVPVAPYVAPTQPVLLPPTTTVPSSVTVAGTTVGPVPAVQAATTTISPVVVLTP